MRSTRANSPALLVSVGLLDEGFEGETSDDGLGGGVGEKSSFSYSGAALAVNVRESDLGGEGEGEEALAEGRAWDWLVDVLLRVLVLDWSEDCLSCASHPFLDGMPFLTPR